MPPFGTKENSEPLRMQIAERRRDPQSPGTLKVTLPPELLVKLHAFKVMTGTNIASTVESALLMYFEHLRRLKDEARAASAASGARAADEASG